MIKKKLYKTKVNKQYKLFLLKKGFILVQSWLLGKVNTILGHNISYREDIPEVWNLTIRKGLTEAHMHSYRVVKEIQVGHG